LACGSSRIHVSCNFCYCYLWTRSPTGRAVSVQHLNIFNTTAAGPGSAKSHSKLATNQRQSTFPNTLSRTGLARSCRRGGDLQGRRSRKGSLLALTSRSRCERLTVLQDLKLGSVLKPERISSPLVRH
jgi:hypothetical protein